MINGNEILDLMYKPMYDEKVLEMMEKLEMKVPELDEKYQLEETTNSKTRDSSIVFEFQETNGYSNNGIPNLTVIELKRNNLTTLPFGLQFDDNYKLCCEKLSKKAKYKSTRRKTIRVWIIEINNIQTELIVNYTDNDFSQIAFVKAIAFDIESLEERLIPNEE